MSYPAFDLCFETDAIYGLSKYLPDLIKGDLDSLRDDVKDYYISKVCSLLYPHINHSI